MDKTFDAQDLIDGLITEEKQKAPTGCQRSRRRGRKIVYLLFHA